MNQKEMAFRPHPKPHNEVPPHRVVTPPLHIRLLAQRLQSLPLEIFWPVIEQFTVFRILQMCIALEDSSIMVQRIATHKDLRHMFPSPVHLTSLSQLFRIFYEIMMILRISPARPAYSYGLPTFLPSALSMDKHDSLHAWTNIGQTVCKHHPQLVCIILKKYLHNEIRRMLNHYPDSNGRPLRHFLKIRYGQWWVAEAYPGIKETNLFRIQRYRERIKRRTLCWYTYLESETHRRMCRIPYPTLVRKSDRSVYEVRAAQLDRMATLVNKHPRLLKKASDPLQIPRRNILHFVTQFRNFASRSDLYACHGKCIPKLHPRSSHRGVFDGLLNPFTPASRPSLV